MTPVTLAIIVVALLAMIVATLVETHRYVNAPCDGFKELPMTDETTDAEQRYCRLRADVRAARDKIGDTPGTGAGLAAIAMLEGILDRHPPVLNSAAQEQAGITRPDTTWCPSCARHVTASQMRQHEGGGRWVDLPECKACLIRKKRA